MVLLLQMQTARTTHFQRMQVNVATEGTTDATAKVPNSDLHTNRQPVPKRDVGRDRGATPPYDRFRAKRKQPTNIVMALIQMCIATVSIGMVSAPTPTTKGKRRPRVKGLVGNKEMDFLVDSGASVSVCSEKMLQACGQNWKLRRIPLPPTLRLTGVTGH